MLEISGYAGNEIEWNPNYGAGSNINFSLDGCNWYLVGKLPNDYGKQIVKISLDSFQARFIQFQNSTYIGIGYLKVIGDKEKKNNQSSSVMTKSQNSFKVELDPLSEIDIFPIEVNHIPYRYKLDQAGSTNVNDLKFTDLSSGKLMINFRYLFR